MRQGFNTVNAQLSLKRIDFDKLAEIVFLHSPVSQIDTNLELVETYAVRAANAAARSMESVSANAKELFAKVEALNPAAVLNRGFAYVTHDDNNVDSVKDVQRGDHLNITLKDGSIQATVD